MWNKSITVLYVSDALRIHQKFKSKIDNDFNDPIANWLNHSKFRILNKLAAAEKKNNCQLCIINVSYLTIYSEVKCKLCFCIKILAL